MKILSLFGVQADVQALYIDFISCVYGHIADLMGVPFQSNTGHVIKNFDCKKTDLQVLSFLLLFFLTILEANLALNIVNLYG